MDYVMRRRSTCRRRIRNVVVTVTINRSKDIYMVAKLKMGQITQEVYL